MTYEVKALSPSVQLPVCDFHTTLYVYMCPSTRQLLPMNTTCLLYYQFLGMTMLPCERSADRFIRFDLDLGRGSARNFSGKLEEFGVG